MNVQLETVLPPGEVSMRNISVWSEGDIDALFDLVSFD